MLKDNLLKYGLLKSRDLVELYFGARMVATIIETSFGPSANPYLILSLDPRRISYEVWFNNVNAGATAFLIGTPQAIDKGTAISVEANFLTEQLFVRRTFWDEFDAVGLPLMISDPGGTMFGNTRSIILTPAPVDEVPLG